MKLRGIELALVTFVGFCLVRGGPDVVFRHALLPGYRAETVLGALVLVATWRSWTRFRQLPPLSGPAAAAFRLGFIFSAVPVVVLAAAQLYGIVQWSLSQAFVFRLLLIDAADALQLTGFSFIPLLVLLRFGLHRKNHTVFSALNFVRELARDGLWAAREWLPLAMAIGIYPLLEKALGAPGFTLDAQMEAFDEALFGADPRVLLEPFITVPLSEWMALSYTSYALFIPLVTGVSFWKAGYPALREITFTVGISLLVAYVSYMLFPVRGPQLTREFTVPLDLYIIIDIKKTLMDASRITWDCFPSMHTCLALLLARSAWLYARKLFWLTLPLMASIPLACVYLRYHYVADVFAGIALAAVMVLLSKFVRPRLDPGATAPVSP